MTLDDKLKIILEDASDNMATSGAIVEVLNQIKQTFADDGMGLKSPNQDQQAAVANMILGHEVMTGQVWFDRFQEELKTKYDQFVDSVDIDMNIYNHGKEAMMLASLEAARIASGIKE